jgi:hypothetical protein
MKRSKKNQRRRYATSILYQVRALYFIDALFTEHEVMQLVKAVWYKPAGRAFESR